MRRLIERLEEGMTPDYEVAAEKAYSHRGFITDWRFPIGGIPAGQLLRDGRAKLYKANGSRVYLKVDGGKEYKVKAGLAKGIQPKFWA